MGLKECQILLDNPWNTYYAGQTVNGRVELILDGPKKVRGITIKFKGEANTKWTETNKTRGQDGKEYDEETALTGHEEYFQIQYYLLGGKNSGEIEIPPGTHTYPFTCALPPTLPSSFEGEFGYVRYTIKVTLDRPWKFDQESKMAFTVISPVDLNQNPRVKEPHKLEMSKTFCCFCCASGPLSVRVSLPVTGFISGQVIPITAEVDNASSVRVEKLEFKLRKTISFIVNNPKQAKKKDVRVIAEIAVGPVEARKSNLWQQKIEVPPLPPSNLVNCGIIDVDYDILVRAVVSGTHMNLESFIPIILGTVPLADFKPPAPNDVNDQKIDISMLPTEPVSPASPPAGGGGAMGWNLAGDAQALYPNIPPPTFAESTYRAPILDRKEDNQYTRIAGEYAPRYPTYSYSPSAPNSNL